MRRFVFPLQLIARNKFDACRRFEKGTQLSDNLFGSVIEDAVRMFADLRQMIKDVAKTLGKSLKWS
ncbi:MAG: hypothetical protein LBU65_06790 [Planctomycetaceae bacterium]|nr:hypothetical protein [Planctomycetaceae bacterium]